MKNEVRLFEQQKVRTHWDEKEEKWYFSVIDVISILTESSNPRDYWFKMKTRVKTEDGLELSTVCRQLKMKASDGKMRETDVAETQVLLRIIQSIPSPRAEPFKQWLAKVGYERMQEIANPEQSLDRARENWQKLGRSKKWIQQRMTGQETRNKLTDYWKESGVQKNDEFAFLTNIIHTEWAGLSVKQHKQLKGLLRGVGVFNWKNKSIFILGSIKEGDKVRLTLPPDFEVVEEVSKNADKINKEEMPDADALLMFSCIGRLGQFGPLVGDEIEGVRKAFSVPMAGFFTYGEFGRTKNGNNEFHNNTCCWVALKEK